MRKILFSHKIRAKASSFHFLLYVNFGSLENESAFFGCLEKRWQSSNVWFIYFFEVFAQIMVVWKLNGEYVIYCIQRSSWLFLLHLTEKKDHFLKVFWTEQCFLFGFLKKLVNWENCLLFLSIASFFFTNKNKKWPKRFFSYQPQHFPFFNLLNFSFSWYHFKILGENFNAFN